MKVLVRTDAAGATHAFTARITQLGMEFSVGGVSAYFDIHTILTQIPKKAWTPAYNADGRPRDGTWVVEVGGPADLSAWPESTRLVLRKERPHPGAQVRITDADGHRITGFLTNTPGGQLADLELRHRRHARVEDRIGAGKDTGLPTCPSTTPSRTGSGWRSAHSHRHPPVRRGGLERQEDPVPDQIRYRLHRPRRDLPAARLKHPRTGHRRRRRQPEPTVESGAVVRIASSCRRTPDANDTSGRDLSHRPVVGAPAPGTRNPQWTPS